MFSAEYRDLDVCECVCTCMHVSMEGGDYQILILKSHFRAISFNTSTRTIQAWQISLRRCSDCS